MAIGYRMIRQILLLWYLISFLQLNRKIITAWYSYLNLFSDHGRTNFFLSCPDMIFKNQFIIGHLKNNVHGCPSHRSVLGPVRVSMEFILDLSWIQTFLRKAQPSQSFLDLIESENSHDSGSNLHPSWSIFGGPVWFEPIWIDFGSIDLDTNHSRLSFQCISFKLFNLYIVLTRLYAVTYTDTIRHLPVIFDETPISALEMLKCGSLRWIWMVSKSERPFIKNGRSG